MFTTKILRHFAKQPTQTLRMFSQAASTSDAAAEKPDVFVMPAQPRIGVVGAGQMGTGIGIVSAAQAKAEVLIVDPNEDALNQSRKFVHDWLERAVKKEVLKPEVTNDIKNRMEWTSDISKFTQVTLAIEAVNEDFELKRRIFENLAGIVPDECLMATNTSSISITKIAGTIPDRAHQVAGMHFMNPVPVMSLVEVI
jgi:3-hydroxybutyryl-CoA dehydrogenase